jgi:hypothetical protein
MSQESLTLSVRLRHASMAPDAISFPMGVQPTATHTVGAPRKSPAGKELGGTSWLPICWGTARVSEYVYP